MTAYNRGGSALCIKPWQSVTQIVSAISISKSVNRDEKMPQKWKRFGKACW